MKQEEEEIARKVKLNKLRHQRSRQQENNKNTQDRPKTMENIPTPSGKRPAAGFTKDGEHNKSNENVYGNRDLAAD